MDDPRTPNTVKPPEARLAPEPSANGPEVAPSTLQPVNSVLEPSPLMDEIIAAARPRRKRERERERSPDDPPDAWAVRADPHRAPGSKGRRPSESEPLVVINEAEVPPSEAEGRQTEGQVGKYQPSSGTIEISIASDETWDVSLGASGSISPPPISSPRPESLRPSAAVGSSAEDLAAAQMFRSGWLNYRVVGIVGAAVAVVVAFVAGLSNSAQNKAAVEATTATRQQSPQETSGKLKPKNKTGVESAGTADEETAGNPRQRPTSPDDSTSDAKPRGHDLRGAANDSAVSADSLRTAADRGVTSAAVSPNVRGKKRPRPEEAPALHSETTSATPGGEQEHDAPAAKAGSREPEAAAPSRGSVAPRATTPAHSTPTGSDPIIRRAPF